VRNRKNRPECDFSATFPTIRGINSNSYADLFKAVDVASNLVSSYGEVSMSWGGSEFSGETSYDSHFKKSGVVYLAASGDTAGRPFIQALPRTS
jgi:hypothetical protein